MIDFNFFNVLYKVQKQSVDFWKLYNLDFSEVLNDIWVYPMYKAHFEGFTKPGGCLEGYQYVTG